MDRFKLAGKELINIYPGTPEEMDLFVKLQKVSAAFMVNLSLGNQANFKAHGMDANAKFNVLA